ncbi:hypothetical protein ACFRMN_16495 [Streptomyces sp. NPDC056835]|uniref:hypothetical protein n=1 Tax=Streptomyces sp. NPDC056835 TaxID=3345956 RepID=UPI0036BB5FE3
MSKVIAVFGAGPGLGASFTSGPGPLAAAARNYPYSLSGELRGTGVYAGTPTVAAVITGSAAAEGAGGDVPLVHPDELAERYWELYTKRDRVELAHPVELTPPDNTGAGWSAAPAARG